MVMTALIVLAGVKDGIEKSTKFLMPLLLLIIVAMGIRAVTLPGGFEGLRFLFKPDFSKITSGVVLSAMGQAFFSLSLGMGCMITYGSYINRKNNLVSTVIEVTAIDTIIAVLAAVAIFPAVFSMGINPAQGPELVFITLPNVFTHMPGGYFWAILFFVLLSVAALTSTISLLEVIVAYFVEEYKFRRNITILVASLGILVLGVLSSFSLGIWKDVQIFGMGFFDLFDNFTSKILMPVGGLFIALFAGWRVNKKEMLEQLSGDNQLKAGVFKTYLFLIRYVAPIGISLIILNQLGISKLLGIE
jgi:NSS family neurotransmitter:Na+ symporter